MKRADVLLLLVVGITLNLLAALLQAVPGYMDAEYYYAGGLQLSQGRGLVEPFIWNFLNQPGGIPVPAYTFWMPLPGVLAGLGMLLAGQSYLAARLPFIILAGLIAPLTAQLAWMLYAQRSKALLAGGLALLPGFYAIYLNLTESFALYMLCGGLFTLLVQRGRMDRRTAFMMGLLAGVMHLSRADGFLWLAAGLLLVGLWERRERLARAGLVLGGYALLMLPWFGRNLVTFGGLLPPGSSRSLWMLDYAQLFNFPADDLSGQLWQQAGLGEVLNVRLDALSSNLMNSVGVQGMVFLLPLMLMGLWRLRREPGVRLVGGMWLLTLVVMSLVFALPGKNGGFFHSGAAIQPLLWALVPSGLEAVVGLGVRWRKWKSEKAQVGFGWVILLLCAVVTGGLFYLRVIGLEPGRVAWNESAARYGAVGEYLRVTRQATDETVVMVNNPPGYYVAARQPAVVIPNGNEQTLLLAARQYAVEYVVLEPNLVSGLWNLYERRADLPGLEYVGEVGVARIYRLIR